MGAPPSWLDIAQGRYADKNGECILVEKFGYNAAVGTAYEPIIGLSVTTATHVGWMTTASTVRIKAGGDAADDAAGLGAQSVTIEGLDENFAIASETVVTAGISASASTTTTFIRVFRAYVAACGTYGAANTAAITIEKTAGSADLLVIPIGAGQSQHGLYTIPAGYTGYCAHYRLHVDTSQAATIRLSTRENADDVATPFSPRRVIRLFTASTGQTLDQHVDWADVFPEKTDVIFETKASSNTSVGVQFDIMLVPN